MLNKLTKSYFLGLGLVASVFLALVQIAVPVQANGGSGTSGAAFLRISPMAKSSSMGNAYTGLATGIESLYFNPAGLVTVDKWDLGLSQILFPTDINYSYGALARRMSDRTVVGMSATYMGAKEDLRNQAGALTGSFTNWDASIGLSVAYAFDPNLSVGGTIRLIQSKLADFDANAMGMDIGFKYLPPIWSGVSIGGSILNAGTGLTYDVVSTPQPLIFRLGGAWEPPHKKYVVSGDLSVDREGLPRAYAGAEYRITKKFMLRAGFDIDNNAGLFQALKLGMGFNSDMGNVDYAFANQGEVGNSHRFSYVYKGGKPKVPIEKKGAKGNFFKQVRSTKEPSKVKIYVLPFVNLSPTAEDDWLGEGFREIFQSRMQKNSYLSLAERKDAKYAFEGRYSLLGTDSYWVGVRIVDLHAGKVVGFKETTIPTEDLIRSTMTLAGAAIASIPRR